MCQRMIVEPPGSPAGRVIARQEPVVEGAAVPRVLAEGERMGDALLRAYERFPEKGERSTPG